jgi:hypothetical protein
VVSFLTGLRDISAAQNLQPGCVAHQWLPGALFLGVKLQVHEAVHPPATSAEVNNEWHCTSLCAFMLYTILLLLLHSLYFTLLYFCVLPLHFISERSHTLTSSSFHILSSYYYRCMVLEDVLHIPVEEPRDLGEFHCSSHNRPQPL